MAVPTPFPYADLLRELEQLISEGIRPTSWPPALANVLLNQTQTQSLSAASHLVTLLHARQAVMQAAFDTAQVADELRRYQKFVKPGRPSPHIVQLRQQQAAARQGSSQSRQALIKAAAAFVRVVGIEPPRQVPLDVFITGWMKTSLPSDAHDASGGVAT